MNYNQIPWTRHVSLLCAALLTAVFVSGCITSPKAVYKTEGAKLPVRVAVFFDSVPTDLKEADANLLREDLENFVRPAVIEALQTGFLEVTELTSPPPYEAATLSGKNVAAVVQVKLLSEKRMIPIVLQIEGYRVQYNGQYTIHKGASQQETGPIEGYAKEATLVITGGGKAKFQRLTEAAAKDLAAKLLTKTYESLKTTSAKKSSPIAIPVLFFIGLAVSLSGCVTGGGSSRATNLHPDDPGTISSTGVDSIDVRSIGQKMARALLDLPEFNKSADEKPAILILPVRNYTRFRIDTAVFTATIRDLLLEQAGDRLAFLAPTVPSELQGKPIAEVTPDAVAANPDLFKNVNFFLKGELHSVSVAAPQGVSDYIRYSFQLVSRRDARVVWNGSYETKKEGLHGIVYQ